MIKPKDLKPCPFCGAEAFSTPMGSIMIEHADDCFVSTEYSRFTLWLNCSDDKLKHWNRRADNATK